MSIFQDAELAAAKQQAEEEAIALAALKKRKEDMAARKRKKQKKVASRASACPKAKPSKELGGREAFASLDLYNKNVPDVKYDGDSQTFVKLMKDGKKVEGARYKEASAISEQDRFLVGIVKGAESLYSKVADWDFNRPLERPSYPSSIVPPAATETPVEEDTAPTGTSDITGIPANVLASMIPGSRFAPTSIVQPAFGPIQQPTPTPQPLSGVTGGILGSLSGLANSMIPAPSVRSGIQRGIQSGLQTARNYVQPYVQQATQTITPLVQQYQANQANTAKTKTPPPFRRFGGLNDLYSRRNPTTGIAGSQAGYHAGMAAAGTSHNEAAQKYYAAVRAKDKERLNSQRDWAQNRPPEVAKTPEYYSELAKKQTPGSTGAQWLENKSKGISGRVLPSAQVAGAQNIGMKAPNPSSLAGSTAFTRKDRRFGMMF
ncbi:MAG: hypothetical protein WDA42_05545 [Candidatus Bathyarchaeia archaeon]